MVKNPLGLAVLGQFQLVFVNDGKSIFGVSGGVASQVIDQTAISDNGDLSLWGIAVLPDGTYRVSDRQNNIVYKLDAANSEAIRFAGTRDRSTTGKCSGDGGLASNAELLSPLGVCSDYKGNVFIADSGHHRIRKVNVDGVITTIAGSGPCNGVEYPYVVDAIGDAGPAIESTLNRPTSVWVNGKGEVYIADSRNHRIRKIDTNGRITTIAGKGSAPGRLGGYGGDGGPAVEAYLWYPMAVTGSDDGTVYVADAENNRIRMITKDGIICTIAGTGSAGFSGDGGPAQQAQINGPGGLLLAKDGSLFVSDTRNNRIRRLVPPGATSSVQASPAVSSPSSP